MSIVSQDYFSKSQAHLEMDGDDHFVVKSTQDVTEVMALNAEMLNSNDERARCAPNGELAARVPVILIPELMRLGIWQDDAKLNQWLDDSQKGKIWKVHPTKLSKRSNR